MECGDRDSHAMAAEPNAPSEAVTPSRAAGETMIPTSGAWLRVLRLGLLVSAAGWGISFYFTFASWSAAADQLYSMGAGVIAYRPMFDYWLKMASSVFGCIGIGSALACWRPRTFAG